MELLAAAEPKETPVCVLMVDDDPLVSALFGRLLRPFKVTFAQSAAGAMGRLQAGAEYDAIVCDIYMPGISGMQFYEEVARLSQKVASRIIFVSGSPSAPEVEEFLRRTGNSCLPKPIEREALRRAVLDAAREKKGFTVAHEDEPKPA